MNKPDGKTEIRTTTKQKGDAAEDRAQRNYRTPGRGGGEIDLIVREGDGTLVFVEVRKRRNAQHGGALASVTSTKQRRIVFAARYFLLKLRQPPPCRFDVVAVEGEDLLWFKAAFEAQ